MLEVKELSVRYDRLTALRGVSLHVGQGEAVAVLGVNGAGKSTLLGTIAGLVKPCAGEVFFCGERVTGQDSHRLVHRGVSLVPEGRYVVAGMSTEENLLLGAVRREQEKNLEKVYALLPALGERRRQAAGLLSGGEQQMLAIGRALMAEPRLLLVDEPTLGLAPKLVRQVFDVLASLRRSGTTILLVEQNVRQTLRMADRVYYMERGVLRSAEPMREKLQSEPLRIVEID